MPGQAAPPTEPFRPAITPHQAFQYGMYPSVLPSLYSQHAGKNTTPIPECMASIPFSYVLQKCGVHFSPCVCCKSRKARGPIKTEVIPTE